MNLGIKTAGTTEVMGMQIPIIVGRFGKDEKYILAREVAELHGVKTQYINQRIKRNILKFNNNDLIDIKGFSVSQNLGFTPRCIANYKNIYLLSQRGYMKLVNIMKDKNPTICEEVIKKYFKSETEILVAIPRKECIFREYLSDVLSQFNIDLEYQKHCLDYRIDIFIPSLNIAIEYDENGHKNYSYENQELRQAIIEKELNCKFIRVTDEYSIGQASGIILKEVMKDMVA